jgi:intergrase/recombinase
MMRLFLTVYVKACLRLLYDLLLDSGSRLVEAIALINNFDEANLTAINGFYRYELAMF